MTDNKTVNVANYVTLAQYATSHEMGDVWRKRLRRAARNAAKRGETFGDVRQMLGKWAIPADAPIPVLPDVPPGKSRADGRKPYRVYATADERDAIANVVGDDNVVNPRIARAARRERKRNERDANESDA